MYNSKVKTNSFRNYIMDYIFDYAELNFALKLIKVSKRFFKLLKVKGLIKELCNKVIIIPYENSIRVFGPLMNQIKQLDGHTGYVRCLTKLNNDLIASGSDDFTVKIWNIDTGECLRTLEENTVWASSFLCSLIFYRNRAPKIQSLTVLQNGFLTSGSMNSLINIWDRKYNCINTFSEHTNMVNCLLTLNNGWLVSGSYERIINVYDHNSDYNCIYRLEGHNGTVMSIKQLPNNDLISIADSIIIWSFNEQFKILKKITTDFHGFSLCILPDNKIASGHGDYTIRIWYVSTMECLSKLGGHTFNVSALLRLSNGHLVSADDKEIMVWKPSNDKNLFQDAKRIDNKGGCFFNSMLEI